MAEVSVIVDQGSAQFKAGFSSNCKVTAVFEPIVAQSQNDAQQFVCGSELVQKLQATSSVNKYFPIENGTINNWDFLEKLYEHMFVQELQCDSTEYNLLLSDSPMTSKVDREKMLQGMMERFGVQGFCVAPSQVLALLANGEMTGITIDSGLNFTHIVPIVEWAPLRHLTTSVPVAGNQVSDFLSKLLMQKGHALYDRTVIDDIKRNTCHVSMDVSLQPNATPAPYELPDGTVVNIDSETFLAPEAIFQPFLINEECTDTLGFIIGNTIRKLDFDYQRIVASRISIAGASTMFPGFIPRISHDITINLPYAMSVKVSAPPERKRSAWDGGNILANMEFFTTSMMITRQEYEEYGARIVHIKCL